MRRVVLMLFVFYATAVFSQDSTRHAPFSRWEFRWNPLSFGERFGGLHLGVETNLDRAGKYSIVSEYGWIFLNNTRYYDSDKEFSNRNKVSGFETKQEFRFLNRAKRNGSSYFGIELHHQQFRLHNSGWFGMGPAPYSYYKHQEYLEKVRSTSLAMKWIRKVAAGDRFNFELFAGAGMIYRDVKPTGGEGTLYQPDADEVYNNDEAGLKPYIAAGIRLNLKIR